MLIECFCNEEIFLTKPKHLQADFLFSFYIIHKNNIVANIVLHSNQMWRDLREFYSLVGAFEKFLKTKKAGN